MSSGGWTQPKPSTRRLRIKPVILALPHSRAVLFPLKPLGPSFIFSQFSVTALFSSWARAWALSPARKRLLLGANGYQGHQEDLGHDLTAFHGSPSKRILGMGEEYQVWNLELKLSCLLDAWGLSFDIVVADSSYVRGGLHSLLQMGRLRQGRLKCPARALSVCNIAVSQASVSSSRMGIPFSS